MRKLSFALIAAMIAATPALAANTDRIAVTTRGTGSDVILIPGLTSSSAVWDGVAASQEKNHRLHIVQVLGFAGTPAQGNANGPVLAPTVEAIHAYIVSHHLKSPAVIGHSLGGLMGMMLAAEHPKD